MSLTVGNVAHFGQLHGFSLAHDISKMIILAIMKRSNFLASVAAIFLAPFGLKAKPKFEREFGPEMIFDKSDKYHLLATAKLEPGATLPNSIVRGPGFSIPYPPIPKDGKEHSVAVQYDCGNVRYFIDGKEVMA